jgi:transposase
MDQIHNILKTYQRTRSIKATARATGCARNAIRSYLRLAADFDQDLKVVLALPGDEPRPVFYPSTPAAEFDREADFLLHFDAWVKALTKTGVTRQLLWEEYRQRVPTGYGYTHWCNLFREHAERRNLTMALDHRPGGLLQFDYAGATVPWVDVGTGEVHQAQGTVAVFPFNQYTFAIALPSQRTADFAHGIVRALSFFGGLPQGIVSGNLKAFVIEPHRYEPTFNQLLEQLGHHYEVDLLAARPRRPKDKAAVEGGVKTIDTRLYAPLRNRLFTSVEEVNEAFLEQLVNHNACPFQKRTGSRRSVFTEQELLHLTSLPTTPFLPKTTVRAKVSLSYHVYLGERGNYYSVAHRYVGKTAEVVYSRDLVEVYVGPDRCHTADRGRYITELNHMPKSHQEWKRSRGFNGDYFRGKTRTIGPATEWAIEQVLASRYHESHT